MSSADLKRRVEVIKQEVQQSILEAFGDHEHRPGKEEIKQNVLNALTNLEKHGKIVSENKTPDVKIRFLWDSWNESQQATWTFINLTFKDVGNLTRRNIDRLNEVAANEYKESWQGNPDDFSWEEFRREPYPWWAIPDPKQIMLADITIKPVQALDFVQFNFVLKDMQ